MVLLYVTHSSKITGTMIVSVSYPNPIYLCNKQPSFKDVPYKFGPLLFLNFPQSQLLFNETAESIKPFTWGP